MSLHTLLSPQRNRDQQHPDAGVAPRAPMSRSSIYSAEITWPGSLPSLNGLNAKTTGSNRWFLDSSAPSGMLIILKPADTRKDMV